MFRPLIAIAIAATAITAPAFATSDDFKMEVDVNRANLATVEQATAEYDRIRDEVQETCATDKAAFRIVERIAARHCEAQTMEKIVAQLNNDNFTAAHQNAS